jgi:hypothetical protein
MVFDVFDNSNDKTVDEINTITITKKTVKFGWDVYQFKNITGFGLIVIKTPPIPLKIIIGTAAIGCLFFLSQINFPYGNSTQWGFGLIGIALLMIWINQNPKKTYGLKLYLPSEENKVFLSNDSHGIQKIVSVLYEFMEKEEDINQVVTITIDQRHARIGIGYAENVNSTER